MKPDKREKVRLVLLLNGYRWTSVQIGKELGIAAAHVRDLLEEQGVNLRPYETHEQAQAWLMKAHPVEAADTKAYRLRSATQETAGLQTQT